MDDHDSLDQLGLSVNFDEQNAALSEILNNGVEEALSTLSPAQLHQLEVNVKKLKMQAKTTTNPSLHAHHHHPEGGRSRSSASASHAKRHAQAAASSVQTLDPHTQQQLLGLDSGAVKGNVSSSATSASSAPPHHSTNLPASCPILEIRDGNEYLIFTYSTKGQLQEFAIKTEIDNISLEEIAEDFKAENCVYPRAFCPKDQYVGNRWEYETACNELAWKLSWINSEILAGKRGLIQRAVDSYRNRLTEMRSRRVVRQEKLTNGTLRRRTADGGYEDVVLEGENIYNSDRPPMFMKGANSAGMLGGSVIKGSGLYGQSVMNNSSLPHHHSLHHPQQQITIPYGPKGETKKMKLRIDIENVNDAEVDERFKQENSIYPDAEISDAMGARRDYELESNEIAWKLAWINEEKLIGNKLLLQKAVDTYRGFLEQQTQQTRGLINNNTNGARKQQPILASSRKQSLSYLDQLASAHHHPSGPVGDFENQKQEEFSAMVVNTLQQALSHHDLASDLNIADDGAHGVGGVYESFHPHLYESNGGSRYYH